MSARVDRLIFSPRENATVLGIVYLAVSYARQALCGLRGHVMVRHFEPDRLSLRCLACGAETPGWTIDVRPSFRLRQRVTTRRFPHPRV
jgi:hypothetical protein